jgi:branched-chain amino acid transport system permease protein
VTQAALESPPLAAQWLKRSSLVFRAVVVVALAIIPGAGSGYIDGVVTEILLYSMFAMSLNLLAGYTGLLSFGHAAFFGLGGYAVMVLAVSYHLNPWLGLIAGIAAAAAYAALTGYFCVRLSGVPFLMLTMAFSQLLYSLSIRWRGITGGTDGLSGMSAPWLFGFSLSNRATMFYVALGFFVLTYWALARLIASQLGHVLIGLRENEERMRAFGYPVQFYKWLSFTIAGSLAGLSGGLFVFYNRFVSPDTLHWTLSGDVLMMVILGGMGTMIGPIVGAAVFLLLKNYVSSHTEHWLMVIGIVFVLCVMFFRDGIWGTLVKRVPQRWRAP